MTNSTLYIYGDLGQGYSQYPSDYTQEFLGVIGEQVLQQQGPFAMLTTHRNDDLMYYCYTRKLEDSDNKQYIGFCVVVNGIMFTNIKELFSVFEEAITVMVAKGSIIGFSPDSDAIVGATSSFLAEQKDTDQMFSFIKTQLPKLEGGAKKLPPVNYGVAKDATETRDIENDDEAEIAECTGKYPWTHITKGENIDSASLLSYKRNISQLCEKNKELSGKCEKLDRNFSELDSLHKELHGLYKQLYREHEELKNKYSELDRQHQQLEQRDKSLSRKYKALSAKYTELDEQCHPLQYLATPRVSSFPQHFPPKVTYDVTLWENNKPVQGKLIVTPEQFVFQYQHRVFTKTPPDKIFFIRHILGCQIGPLSWTSISLEGERIVLLGCSKAAKLLNDLTARKVELRQHNHALPPPYRAD